MAAGRRGPGLTGEPTAALVPLYADGPAWVAAQPRATPSGLRMGGHRTPAPTAPAPFHASGQTWQFTWLKYMAGAVTVAPLGNGVMTGPMSGCYLFRYRQGGNQMVAHVGTSNTPTEDRTIWAKTDWHNLTRQPGVTDVWGYSPRDHVSDMEFTNGFAGPPASTPAPSIVGYFAADGTVSVMLLAPVPASARPPVPLLKVTLVKKVTLTPWASLKAMRRFQM
jgi:hypothetical protein